jgi:hypothetical protein
MSLCDDWLYRPNWNWHIRYETKDQHYPRIHDVSSVLHLSKDVRIGTCDDKILANSCSVQSSVIGLKRVIVWLQKNPSRSWYQSESYHLRNLPVVKYL